MLINTRDFGQKEVDEKQIIDFPVGILGFENEKRFALLDSNQPPFYYLQSLNDVELVFVLLSPEVFKSDYVFNVSDIDLKEINVEEQTELVVFAIVNMNGEGAGVLTANLQGPIVINSEKGVARQCIALNTDYHLKHNVIEEMNSKEKLSC